MYTIRNLFLVVALALVGCDSISITEPFGEPLANEDLKTVVGRWTDAENNIIELRLSNTNELIGGHLTWDEKSQRFVSKSDKLDVRTAEKTIYIFQTDEKVSSFARIELIDNEHINLYVPFPKSFRDAVKTGSLTGLVSSKENDNFHVTITTDSKLTKALASADWRHYYYPDAVLSYKRIPAAKQGRTTD